MLLSILFRPPPFSLYIPDSLDITGSSQTPPVITCFLRCHRSSSVIRDSLNYHMFPQMLQTPPVIRDSLSYHMFPQMLQTPSVIRDSLSYHMLPLDSKDFPI